MHESQEFRSRMTVDMSCFKSSCLFVAFPTCKFGKNQDVFVVTIKCNISIRSVELVVFISTGNIFVLGWQAVSYIHCMVGALNTEFVGSGLKATLYVSQLHNNLILKAQDAGS